MLNAYKYIPVSGIIPLINSWVALMDLDIIGHKGMFRLDDFVLDWKQGFAFDNPNHITGFFRRSEMQSPEEYEFIKIR